MIDKEGNVLLDDAVLGINAIPFIGRLEIQEIIEEDISLNLLKSKKDNRASQRGHAYREAFLVNTNLRGLCKYNS